MSNDNPHPVALFQELQAGIAATHKQARAYIEAHAAAFPDNDEKPTDAVVADLLLRSTVEHLELDGAGVDVVTMLERELALAIEERDGDEDPA